MVCGVWCMVYGGDLWCVVCGTLVVNHCHRQEVTPLSLSPLSHMNFPQSPINEEFYYSAIHIHSGEIAFNSFQFLHSHLEPILGRG